MKNKARKVALFLLIAVLIIFIIIYFAISIYYQKKFMLNTWINGVYCTGKSVEEVNNELLDNSQIPSITLVGADGKKEVINLIDVGYFQDLRPILTLHLNSQEVLSWPIRLVRAESLNLLPAEVWDKERLHQMILESDAVTGALREKSSIDVKIVLGENGYELYDGMHDVFDADAFAEAVIENYNDNIFVSDVSNEEFYYVQSDTKAQAAERILWTKLEEFLNTGFVLDMGAEKIVFDKSITSDFVLTDQSGAFVMDENGGFIFDEGKITEYVRNLLQRYNTVGTTKMFQTTNGDLVEVPYNTYGTEIDVEAETVYIVNALMNDITETYSPTYLQEGYVKGLNDIGDTYIEVDMTMQKLYCYKNGELIIETDIVTGNMKRGWDTPCGINYVYAKQKKRVLRGANYATPVDFWMPVVGNIGLHDADWRDEFGGEIYMTNGSHGCVNIPIDIMPTIYEEYEVGTPVIMFY